MKTLCGILAVVIASVVVVIGLSYSVPQVQAQGSRQVEVKRVSVDAGGSGQVTTQTLGVPVGISCLELRPGAVDCFVVSTR
jgi:hypothetical protein